MIVQIICVAVVIYGIFVIGRLIFNFIKDLVFDVRLSISACRDKPYQFQSDLSPEEIEEKLFEEWERGEAAIELAIAEKNERDKYNRDK